ncbi:WD40 domain-containing protein/BCAS3 domain-containing protein [Cephalotus follicularis]|uniref:WD40 domain-containing protein/BCAS3 domain-containing protein n=1 Tax=Cephalotus follicularis TaxID=3775 RepID=A0A1Q3AZ69_CEPFO|nr:WD40 domain-containing protein/BCAS3 domain-containing protein [Cephalotus follicularis]
MRNSDGQKQKQQQGGGVLPPRNNGLFQGSFRAISSYLRIVSSGASTVARSAVSAASSIVDRDVDGSHDQVLWAGFDKLEGEGGIARRVLLLGYRSGFQVWDVEEADNVRDLVSRHDGPVSFLQMLPKPIASKGSGDKFAGSRPLLAVCVDGSLSGACNIQDGLSTSNKSMLNYQDPGNGGSLPTVVRFYSLRSQSYVHTLKFRSVIYSVRCSSRVVAISQAAQIHCFGATTLEREYTILTNPIVTSCPGSGGIGYGPLAVGPRWLAYSGSPVAFSNTRRVSPQHLTPSVSFSGFSSNGSLVAHYAKESSKQLAAGIVTLGDIGYKKISRYYSELLPDSNNSPQSGSPGWKGNVTINGQLCDADNIGMVIVRDIVSKVVIAQFRAHKSPISALCFDPSGTILVTASVQGHNINVYKIMPGLSGNSSACDAGSSYVHLYRLQRGFTNAVIQDISFSDDSNWIMISSSRGTSHLFAINPLGGSVNFQSADASFTSKNNGLVVMTKPAVRWPPNLGLQMPNQHSLCAPGPPVTLSVVSRIRNGNNGWRGTVSGAAAAATGRMSSLSGAIASSFHNCKGNNDLLTNSNPLKTKYHLLFFSTSGCMIQYALRISAGLDSAPVVSGLSAVYDSAPECDTRLVIEAIQKWNICQKQNRREREDNIDIYGENGNSDCNKIYPAEGMKNGNGIYPEGSVTVAKAKMSPEEKHHLYISEAELQVYQSKVPLWAKPEIYFQSMMHKGVIMDDENKLEGEIEVERVPTRMIEARSKDLVPIFERLPNPKLQQARIPAVDSNGSGQLLHQRYGLSENGSVSRRCSSGSLDSMSDSGATVAEFHNGVEETGRDSPRMPIETRGSVNNNDSPETQTRLEIVNKRESLKLEAQLKFVNNSNEGLKMENHFEDEGVEFD